MRTLNLPDGSSLVAYFGYCIDYDAPVTVAPQVAYMLRAADGTEHALTNDEAANIINAVRS